MSLTSSSSPGTTPDLAAVAAPQQLLSSCVPVQTTTTTAPPPLCKHWARSKICLYHAQGKCRFDHPPDYEIPPPPQRRNKHHRDNESGKKKSRRRRRQQQQTDLTARHRSAGGRLQTRNDARVAILRAFLAGELARHGLGDLSALSVLDVAGGKGELAFQLLNLNNVERCHVIDPRPLSLGRFRKRLEKGFYHRSQGILQHDVVRPRSEPERPVEQLRCLFSSELWEKTDSRIDEDDDDNEVLLGAVGETKESEPGDGGGDTGSKREDENYRKQREKFFANCHKARGWVWPPVGSANEHAGCCGNDDFDEDDGDDPHHTTTNTNTNTHGDDALPSRPPSENDNNDDDVTIGPAFDHAASVVRNADLIVGMHPDQAVDAIVDAALYQNISFFVVPCCVFPREFPHRRVRVRATTAATHNENENDDESGPPSTVETTTKRVTRYEELVDYLQAKSPDIRRHVLPFEGRNICLYRVVPPREPASPGETGGSRQPPQR